MNPNDLVIEDDTPQVPIQPPNDDATNAVPPQATPSNEPESTHAPYGLKKDGTPAKRRGRKPKDALDPETVTRLESVTQAPPRVQAGTPIAAPPPIAVDYGMLGKTAATLWFGIGETFLGEEWAPETGEPKIVADAFSKYFETQNINDIPPGVSLSLILGSYALKRSQKPGIKSKLAKGWTWAKNLFKR